MPLMPLMPLLLLPLLLATSAAQAAGRPRGLVSGGGVALEVMPLPFIGLQLAGGPPNAPWFGPSVMWTPPWFNPVQTVEILPEPAHPGTPSQHSVAMGIRSRVFNRLIPNGELATNGPAHQLSDGRIFMPRWKKDTEGKYFADWKYAEWYREPPYGCGKPKSKFVDGEQIKTDGEPLSLELNIEAAEHGVKTFPGKGHVVPGECYTYGNTQYCLPARNIEKTGLVDGGWGPDLGSFHSQGSLKDEAMGLIPRGPFPWQKLGLTTAEIMHGGPGGLITASKKDLYEWRGSNPWEDDPVSKIPGSKPGKPGPVRPNKEKSEEPVARLGTPDLGSRDGPSKTPSDNWKGGGRLVRRLRRNYSDLNQKGLDTVTAYTALPAARAIDTLTYHAWDKSDAWLKTARDAQKGGYRSIEGPLLTSDQVKGLPQIINVDENKDVYEALPSPSPSAGGALTVTDLDRVLHRDPQSKLQHKLKKASGSEERDLYNWDDKLEGWWGVKGTRLSMIGQRSREDPKEEEQEPEKSKEDQLRLPHEYMPAPMLCNKNGCVRAFSNRVDDAKLFSYVGGLDRSVNKEQFSPPLTCQYGFPCRPWKQVNKALPELPWDGSKPAWKEFEEYAKKRWGDSKMVDLSDPRNVHPIEELFQEKLRLPVEESRQWEPQVPEQYQDHQYIDVPSKFDPNDDPFKEVLKSDFELMSTEELLGKYKEGRNHPSAAITAKLAKLDRLKLHSKH